MATRSDGTEAGIAHGSVYLRQAERSDIPLFVRWFNDTRTSKTLARRRPDVDPLGGGLVRADARSAGQGRLPLHDLPARGRPPDRHDRAVRPRPPQRERGPRDLDRRPGGHEPGVRERRAPRARRLGLRHAPARARLARRLRLQPARAARSTSESGSSTRGRSGTRSSATAASPTSTGWRSSPANGGRARRSELAP